MNKVVITGATGMIGLAVLHECISHGKSVLAIVRPNSININRIPKSPQVSIFECEADEYSKCKVLQFGEEWDVFFHFAWNSIDSADRDNVDMQNQNIRNTLSAVRLAKQLGCRMFVGAGSQAEYGTFRTGKVGPDTPTNPIDAYGIAKLSAGKFSAILAQQLDMISVWVRIFSIYGPYDRSSSLIQSTIKKMVKNEVPKFTEATQLWDYLYSSDAGRAFFLIGEKCRNTQVYCLGSGESRPLIEYINILHRLINPNLELGIGQIPTNSPPVSIEADIRSLTDDVGFVPNVTFKQGIVQMLARYTA